MGCSDNKKIYRIQNLDRVSQLPDPIILSILSRLPLEDSARASILSKTRKNYCRLYPILYFDHNLFALQSLGSATEFGGGEPDFSQLRVMFMDDVDHRLTSARHLDSPIRKLALNIHDTDTFKEASNLLKKLILYSIDNDFACVKEVSVTELEKSSWNITMRDAYDTTWLMNLREFIVPLIGNKTIVSVNFKLPMATFERELVGAIEDSPRHNFSLLLELDYDEENVAALVDGILWIIRPTTFIINCQNYILCR
ncbi:putative F-box protein At3g58950 [Silene latifolia]|uniref:putative F-box protein At3g58950 n=1 Tax=Silene latifolia TaxID=37657 RepID=UPI003D7869F0